MKRAPSPESRGSWPPFTLVNDPTATSDYHAGERVPIRVLRGPILPPDTPVAGWMRLELQTPHGGAPEAGAPSRASSVPDTAVVERVLSSEVGAYRAVAYLVGWRGATIGVTDLFASTHFRPAERITYQVVRANDATAKHLRFRMPFNLPP